MARGGPPSGNIDWASADVRGSTLTVPLTGRRTKAWAAHLADLVRAALSDDGGWKSIDVTRTRITVYGMRRGVAAGVHDLLERLVARTNAAFTPQMAALDRARYERLSSIAISFVLVLLALAAVALQSTDWALPVRPVVVVAFVLVAPGWAILRLWGLAHGWVGVGLVLALSLSLAMIVAGATLYAGAWSPRGSLIGLAAATVVACAISLVRGRRDRNPVTDGLGAR